MTTDRAARFLLMAIYASVAFLFSIGQSWAVDREEFHIPGGDPGIEIRLIHKAPIGKTRFADGDVVLMLHPFGVPTADAYDVDGFSWMEDLVARGFDVWAMDARGFGGSTRPEGTSPVVRAEDAVRDTTAVMTWIAARRGVTRLSLVGWSWGGVVAPMTAIAHPDLVMGIVVFGTMYGFALPSMTQPLEDPANPGHLNPKLPAYQVVEPAKALHHWHMMLDGIEDVAPEETIHKIEHVLLDSDATATNRQPPAMRRPMGPLVDLYNIWTNHPIYDAARVPAPILVARGDADIFADAGLAAHLTGAKTVRELVIHRATHWLPYEANRQQLLDATGTFLRAVALGQKAPDIAQPGDARLGELVIASPWARASAGKAPNGIAFLRVTNRGPTADRLIAASSPVATKAELHVDAVDNGIMKMRDTGGIEIPPGATVELKPEGLHIMLLGLKAPLKEGEKFPLRLQFEKAGEIDVETTVDKVGATAPHHHHDHMAM